MSIKIEPEGERNLKSKIQNHQQAAAILLAFIVLSIIYSLVTPPFEAGDESRHYAVIKYMADTGRLITQNVPETQTIQRHWSHEGNQPPLYYALAAALTSWIDTGAWDDVFWYNPHTTIGNPLRPDNKNITIHPSNTTWPWRGHVLAVHLIRFMSIIMATVTVATCYAIALNLFKGNRWLAAGAMSITAFNPMFIFISASINNDNAVIMFITLALWLMIHIGESANQQTTNLWVSPSNPKSKIQNLKSPALLGLLIGLGALSKLYALGLLPLAGLLFIWLAYKTDSQPLIIDHQSSITPQTSRITHHASRISSPFWRKLLVWSSILGFTVITVVGWFYWRNALLYQGDFLALDVMRTTAGQRDEIPSLATIRAEFKGFRIAYWALFGGVNILVNEWIYILLDWISLIAIFGLIGFLISNLRLRMQRNPKSKIQNLKSKISRPTFTILLSWCFIMIAGFIIWNITQPAGQGRLFYPAIAAISALGMLGLSWWLSKATQFFTDSSPNNTEKALVSLCAISLFLFAVLSPVLYIAPVYAKPTILSQTDLPPNIQPVDFTYDNAIKLIGYQLHTDTVHPAQTLPLTLYWQIIQPTNLDYSIFVHILGRQREVIGQIDTYPGGGEWPTTLLTPGDILADTYEIPILPETEFSHAPTRLHIAAGIYDYFEAGRPGRPAINAAGDPTEPIIATAKLIPWQWPQANVSPESINFFDKVTLLNYQVADDQQSITFNWQVNTHLETDYTVFIQALQTTTNEYVTGFDGPPVQGDYPTSLWSPGEIIIDTHPLDLTSLSPDTYNLIAGLYNPTTGERLPAFNANGPLPNYAVHLGQLQVTK